MAPFFMDGVQLPQSYSHFEALVQNNQETHCSFKNREQQTQALKVFSWHLKTGVPYQKWRYVYL